MRDKCNAYVVSCNCSNACSRADGRLWTYYDESIKKRRNRYEADRLHWALPAHLYAIDLLRAALRFAPLTPQDPHRAPPPPPVQPDDSEEEGEPAPKASQKAIAPAVSTTSASASASTSTSTSGNDCVEENPPRADTDLRETLKKKKNRTDRFGSIDGSIKPTILPPALRNQPRRGRTRGLLHHLGDWPEKRAATTPEKPGVYKQTRYEGK